MPQVTKRFRFGIKAPVFKNAGIMIIYLNAGREAEMRGIIDTLKGLLIGAGYPSYADRIVFELAQ